MSVARCVDKMASMFTVDEPTAAAIRRAFDDGGELAGVVELRRHFPLIADNAHARLCVRAIAGWKPIADQPGPPANARRAGLKDRARAKPQSS
jgi:hypothetical protein